MTSIIFTDEEARYLRAILKWQEKPPEENRASWILNGLHMPEKAKPVGEFRILVIGAQGVGKTSLLTKFCTGVFPDPSTLPSSSYLHGCRHVTDVDGKLYTIDALQLPPEHLASPEHLAQAIAITEAAVLVYDITDPCSLTYLKSLANTIHESLQQHEATTPTKKRNGVSLTSSPTSGRVSSGTESTTRPYHFLLLGAKSDVSPSLRQVSWLEGHTVAAEFFGPTGVAGGSSASFMEVSAQTGKNVGAVFSVLGKEISRSRRERKESQQTYGLGDEARGIGGFGWDCSEFGLDDHGNDTDGDAGGSGTMTGSMRRKWSTLKATLSASIFKK